MPSPGAVSWVLLAPYARSSMLPPGERSREAREHLPRLWAAAQGKAPGLHYQVPKRRGKMYFSESHFKCVTT